MKALFVHELRRGRLFPVFGLVVGLLVAVLRGFYGAYVPLIAASLIDDEDLFFGVLLAAFVIALAGGAGLFASEVESGTLPALLALPLSRQRVWLAKVLAGLMLAVGAATALVALSYPALPHRSVVMFRDDPWVLVLWWFVAFFAAVLSSALFAHMVSALMAALLFTGGIFVLTEVLATVCGGALLGYSDLVDATLWALALAPGLLLGSVMAFARGELLRSWSRWRFAAYAVLLYGGAVIVLIAGGFRWATRYERAHVDTVTVDLISPSQNGAVAVLYAMLSPISRQGAYQTSHFRSAYTVLVDLKTGRELAVRRGYAGAAVSADLRWAAFGYVPEPFTLTWRPATILQGVSRIEIRDLRTGRVSYPSWPPKAGQYRYMNPFNSIGFSPDGSWLALISPMTVVLMRRDGSDAVAVPLWTGRHQYLYPGSWAWDPSGKAVYALTTGLTGRPRPLLLIRRDLPGGRTTTIWNPTQAVRLPPGYALNEAQIAVSPDGRWIAVALMAALTRPDGEFEGLAFVFLVSADGKQSLLLWRTSPQNALVAPGDYVWSKDSGRLYWLVHPGSGPPELLIWRRGRNEAASVPLPARSSPSRIALLPNGDLLIAGFRNLMVADENGQIRPFPSKRVAASLTGAGRHYSLLGVDAKGRGIVAYWHSSPSGLPTSVLGAMDLATGKFKQIYP